jgi:hypothetical protein
MPKHDIMVQNKERRFICPTKMPYQVVFMGFLSTASASVVRMMIVGTGNAINNLTGMSSMRSTEAMTMETTKMMKRPLSVSNWDWEHPGYWAFRNNHNTLTVGDCGVQIHSVDMSENFEALGSEDNPLDIPLVLLHDTLTKYHLEEEFLAVVYLCLQGYIELRNRGINME